MIRSRKQNKAGFVLLYSVLVTTVVLAVGLVLSNIITKQIILSIVARDSQVAFYAADSGYECLQYWANEGIFTGIGAEDDFDFNCIEGGDNYSNQDDYFPLFFVSGSCANAQLISESDGKLIVVDGFNLGTGSVCPAPDNSRLVYRVRSSITSTSD
ncbi:MAG: hypothetical protein WDZ85_00915 [Candidatus Paceibacterota bacterium]